MRKVCYITGTRADFGLMSATLNIIQKDPDFCLDLIVTGMHLLEQYGNTWQEIQSAGLSVRVKVAVELFGDSGSEMSIALSHQINHFTQALEKNKPDVLLLLGDRGEMLAGAIAALHLNIHIVHIHGGERSGTIDESIRHAISKLAHYHFTSTAQSRERLVRMGESADRIFVTGAPGLDSITGASIEAREDVFKRYGLSLDKPLILTLFHPVVQQNDIGKQMHAVLHAATSQQHAQVLVIAPNSDAGGSVINNVIAEYKKKDALLSVVHLPRTDFISLMSHASVMLGNSSSGIIEAASLSIPVINVGDRQRNRERNLNVIDVQDNVQDIISALQQAEKMRGMQWDNVYGCGDSCQKIADNLKNISLDTDILEKVNSY